jgi:hypothetical protein
MKTLLRKQYYNECVRTLCLFTSIYLPSFDTTTIFLLTRTVWNHTLNQIIFSGLFVFCFNQIQNTVGNPEAFSEFKRMNGWTKYVSCTSLDGIVSGTCYCTPVVTRGFSLQACELAALVFSSKSMLWQYCSLRTAGTFVACMLRYGGDRRQDHRWGRCSWCSCVHLKAYKKFFF